VETLFVCTTCGGTTATGAGAAGAAGGVPFADALSAPVPAAGDSGEDAPDGVGACGAPVHVQFHTQLQAQAWSIEKPAATPFGPVHDHAQIQCPETEAAVELLPELAGCDIEEPAVVAEVELEVFVSAGDGAAAAAVCAAIHDQIQLVLDVEACAGSVGMTPRSHTQFQIHASEPVGRTSVVPGSTTLTLMLFSPVVEAVADAPLAVDELIWAALPSAPGLPIRTLMLTFVGLVCVDDATDEGALCGAPEVEVSAGSALETAVVSHALAH
jgi:hypothetical protein